jgi:hypothetical protein
VRITEKQRAGLDRWTIGDVSDQESEPVGPRFGAKGAVAMRLRLFLVAVIWASAFVGLAYNLEPSPTHQIQGTGWLRFEKPVGASSFVGFQTESPNSDAKKAFQSRVHGPLLIVHAPTGKLHALPLGPASAPLHYDSWHELGTPRSPDEWQMVDWSVWRDRVVVWLASEGKRAVHLVDVRTGVSLFQHEESQFDVKVLQDRIWIYDKARPSLIRAIDLETGRDLPTRLTGRDLHWDDFRISPNGELVAGHLGDRFGVWRVSDEQQILNCPSAAEFAFSADSRRFATISAWKTEDSGPQRTWRLFDIAAGAVLHEQIEVRQSPMEDEDPNSQDLGSESGRLNDENLNRMTVGVQIVSDDECVSALLNPSIFLRPGRYKGLPLQEVTSWNIPARQFTRTSQGFPNLAIWWLQPMGAFEPAKPEYLWIEDADGTPRQKQFKTLTGLTDHYLSDVSADGRWGVTSHRTSTMKEILPRWLSRNAGWLFSGTGHVYSVYDIRSGACWMTFTEENLQLSFTNDGNWLIVQDSRDIRIWELPLRRPWARALGWSFGVPILAALFLLRRKSAMVSSRPRAPRA